MIAADGSYRVKLPVGPYRVVVLAPGKISDKMADMRFRVGVERFCLVRPQDPNTLSITLAPPPPKP